jgi:hypothetical protein
LPTTLPRGPRLFPLADRRRTAHHGRGRTSPAGVNSPRRSTADAVTRRESAARNRQVPCGRCGGAGHGVPSSRSRGADAPPVVVDDGLRPGLRSGRADLFVGGSLTKAQFAAEEREMLLAYLQRQRDLAVWKVRALPDDARSVATSSGLTIHGIVRHLVDVERSWLRRWFAGQPGVPVDGIDRYHVEPRARRRPGGRLRRGVPALRRGRRGPRARRPRGRRTGNIALGPAPSRRGDRAAPRPSRPAGRPDR